MCNRYTPARGFDAHRDKFGRPQVNFPPPRRIGPFDPGIFVRVRDGIMEEVHGQWGMIRPGSRERIEKVARKGKTGKDGKPVYELRLTNNCRSESMAEKPTFKAAWSSGHRCLIPAWGYDEPNWETGRNVWWEMRRADARAWMMAGLWSEWTDPATGELVPNYTMVTMNCNHHPLLSRMHRPELDRATGEPLPFEKQDKRAVIALDESLWGIWLGGAPAEALQALVLPAEDVFEAGPAGTATHAKGAAAAQTGGLF